MQNTTNYNLNKPDGNDFAKIQSLNENSDIIDAKLKDLEDSIGDIDFSNINQAIANVDSRVTTHLDESMAHKYVGADNKTYRWGFGEDAGGVYFAREEVV